MSEKVVRSQCQIQKHIQVICPFCENIIAVPMNMAVNGEVIRCDMCGKTFVFRKEDEV